MLSTCNPYSEVCGVLNYWLQQGVVQEEVDDSPW